MLELPVPTVPKTLGVALEGLPNIAWLPSPLVTEAEVCPNSDPVAPDNAPKAKEAAGFGCTPVEVDAFGAASSFFPNMNVDGEKDGPNVVVPRTEVGLEMSVALEDIELSVAEPDVDLFSTAPLNADVN